jgi:hypothetical protein
MMITKRHIILVSSRQRIGHFFFLVLELGVAYNKVRILRSLLESFSLFKCTDFVFQIRLSCR